MLKPKYTVTQKLLANIKRIAVLAAGLNQKKLPRPVLANLEREARALSAYSSTSIEGNPLPLTEVKRILKTRPEHVRDSEKEVLNYNQALLKLSQKKKIAFNLVFILETHRTIMAGLLEKYRLGKIRKEPVFVNDPRTGQTIYWPPDHKEVKRLMEDLIAYVVQNQRKIDPLILAGVFHRQCVIIHPFIDGNGRTTRLATKALLSNMGIDLFNLFSFENYYNQNVSKYFQKVGVRGKYYDLKDKIDFTEWLEYFTDGIIDELLRVEKELTGIEGVPAREIKPHHKIILKQIQDHGSVSDPEYAKLTKRSKASRNLDFRKMISLGLIEKVGKGKATYYRAKT
ncbi:MAG: Fic family protein [Candidatus Margulisiibacteriota bacterium]